MLYTPKNVQQKTGKSGKSYMVADFEDMNGQITENVSTFDAIVENRSLDGEISQNGIYLNFKSKPSVQSKSSQIGQAMDKKIESISNFQDAKEKSIQLAGAITNANNATIALLQHGTFSVSTGKMTEEEFKTRLRHMIVFYQNLYKHPEDINPSSSELGF